MADTRQRLVEGAFETVRRHGVAGVSARTIAGVAGANQALIFYHFGSVDALLVEACRAATARRVDHYRDQLAAVTGFRELLDLGRRLHAEERELGNVTVLAQLLAGAQGNPQLAEAVRAALDLWTAEIEQVLARLLRGSPLRDLVDPAGLAKAVSAGFVGLELYEAADPEGAGAGLAALEQLGVLLEVVDELGPLARRALTARLNRR
ncbi:TetR family transcriptional regulator [Kibdelosporangium lantanae]